MSNTTVTRAERFTGFVGRTADGARVFLEINLREKTGRAFETVTHETIEAWDSYTELTISGSRIEHRGRNVSSCGQNRDDLAAVVTPAPGLSLAELAQIGRIWQRWHLNGLQAACAAQEVVYERNEYGARRPSLELTAPCPQTGYRYGHAWLVEELPTAVEDQVRAFAQKLDGNRKVTTLL